MNPSSIFSIPSLKALTACSACPFEAGCYGDTLVYLMPFFERKFSNSTLVKLGPLLLTMVSGRPWVTKISLNFIMVAADVVLHIMWTSIHLECASITTKYIWPLYGVHIDYAGPYKGLTELTRLTGPLPWVEWCFCWGLLVQLALLTPFNCIFWLTVHVWPPCIITCKGFHPW